MGGQAVTRPGPATSPALPEELPGAWWEGPFDRWGGLLLGASLLKDLDRKPQGRGGPLHPPGLPRSPLQRKQMGATQSVGSWPAVLVQGPQ